MIFGFKGDKSKVELMNVIYPVGSIYMSVNNTNPGELFGGTWVAWGSGKVPVGVDTAQTEFNTVEKSGGAKTHTLSVNEMPAHTHTYNHRTIEYMIYAEGSKNRMGLKSMMDENTGSTGGGQAHNNLQPYITCYMWKRTA